MKKIKVLFFLISATIFCSTTTLCYSQPSSAPNTQSGMVIYDQRIDLRPLVIKTDTLLFDSHGSIFGWNMYNSTMMIPDNLRSRLEGTKVANERIPLTGQINFYDTEADSMYSRRSMRHLGRFIYLKEPTPQISWSISDSTKMVGAYRVQKATTQFRGRSYTAWFTPVIPVPYGPWKLHGLPGLILQAYDQSGDIYFSARSVSLQPMATIGPIPLTGEEQHYTLEEYKALMANFEKEMKANYLRRFRGVGNKSQLANMDFDLPDYSLIETFDEDN